MEGGTPINRLVENAHMFHESNTNGDIVDNILVNNGQSSGVGGCDVRQHVSKPPMMPNQQMENGPSQDEISQLIEYLKSEIMMREQKIHELLSNESVCKKEKPFDERKYALIIAVIALVMFSEPVLQFLVKYVPTLITPTGNATFMSVVVRAGLVGVGFYVFHKYLREKINF